MPQAETSGSKSLPSIRNIRDFSFGNSEYQLWTTERQPLVLSFFSASSRLFSSARSPLPAMARQMGLTPDQLFQFFLFLADKTLGRCIAFHERSELSRLLTRTGDPNLRLRMRQLSGEQYDWLTLDPLPRLPRTLLCSTLHSLMAETLGKPVDCLLCYRFCVLARWEPLDEARFYDGKKGTGPWFFNRIKNTRAV